MNHRLTCIASTTVIALTSGLALGADAHHHDNCDHTNANTVHESVNHAKNAFPNAIAHPDTIFARELAARLLPLLPAEDKFQILASDEHAIGTDAYEPKAGAGIISFDIENDEDFAKVSQYASPELWMSMSPVHRQMLTALANRAENGLVPAAACFAPDSDPNLVAAFNAALMSQVDRFQQTSRWGATATNGGGLDQGDPTILTYSFAPDGTFCPSIIGVTGNSNFHAWMNGIYGSQATWQDLFQQVFDRWSELCNTTYVYEPNDDGVNLNGSAGLLGVRGDIRIAAITIDGNSNTLAYNNFPNDGDMVFDSADSFFNNTGANSRRFRNVAAHEHGHGLGMLHVCPISETKLMEPFYSGNYDGPQLDDILNGQRHYGDIYEPNDNPQTQATDLGDFGGFGIANISRISIDDNADVDYFLLNVTIPSQITFAVNPAAATYNQGGQNSNGSCSGGTSINYNTMQDLRIDAYDADNVFVALQTENSTSAGTGEIMVFNAIETGEYLFRVSAASSTNNIQLYNLSVLSADLPFLNPTISSTPPANVSPGVTTDFNVVINPFDDTVVPGSAQLRYRVNGSAFNNSPLISAGGNNYTATLPAVNCDDTLEFYITLEGDTAGTINLPSSAPSELFSADVGEINIAIDDNFETNMGWIVTGDAANASEGRWQRAVPSGDGSRGDAPTDFDGSGFCYVTGNGGPNSNTDVDGGQTILTSPTLDLSENPTAVVSYARWYDNTGSGGGAAPGADVFTVQISNNNGSTWTDLEVVGPSTAQSSGGWFQSAFTVSDFVALTDQIRVRFIAEDAGDGSVIEAAVDAFSIIGESCENPDTCVADFTGEGILDIFDVFAFLDAYEAQDSSADFTGEGTFDIFDVFAFLDAYEMGCP